MKINAQFSDLIARIQAEHKMTQAGFSRLFDITGK